MGGRRPLTRATRWLCVALPLHRIPTPPTTRTHKLPHTTHQHTNTHTTITITITNINVVNVNKHQISCAWGFTTSGGAKGVGESTTSAVVISLVAIFVLDFGLSFAFFQGQGDALKQLK